MISGAIRSRAHTTWPLQIVTIPVGFAALWLVCPRRVVQNQTIHYAQDCLPKSGLESDLRVKVHTTLAPEQGNRVKKSVTRD